MGVDQLLYKPEIVTVLLRLVMTLGDKISYVARRDKHEWSKDV